MDATTITACRESVESEFSNQFQRSPSVVVAAPGRVNLIGEHIDYNDGFVLPFAIERYIVIAAAVSNEPKDSHIKIHSKELEETQKVELSKTIEPGRKGWISYIDGVIAGFQNLGVKIPPFEAVIGSTIPLGAGLSSSAALEVATATLIEQMTGHFLDPRDKALLCQKAEHEFAGMPCGIMDQFSSVFGKESEFMLIDCRSLEVQPVMMDSEEVSILITNSNVQHELTGSEYAARRAESESALHKLEQNSWRDLSMEFVEQNRRLLTEIEYRRAKHIVSEIKRTLDTAYALQNNDWDTVGVFMYDSHQSLKDDYEVSCPEIDLLVDLAKDIGKQGGIYGSRITGGGFGGCTVSLVRNEKIDTVAELISSKYQEQTGITPYCFSSRPAHGARVLKRMTQEEIH